MNTHMPFTQTDQLLKFCYTCTLIFCLYTHTHTVSENHFLRGSCWSYDKILSLPQKLQHVYSKNEDLLVHNHNITTKRFNTDRIKSIYIPYSNYSNCSNNIFNVFPPIQGPIKEHMLDSSARFCQSPLIQNRRNSLHFFVFLKLIFLKSLDQFSYSMQDYLNCVTISS